MKNLKRVYILIVLDIIFIKIKGGNNMKERFKYSWNELKDTFFQCTINSTNNYISSPNSWL